MADRLMVMTHLMQLAEDAAQRGDDRAAGSLRDAAKMLYEDGAAALALERRRISDNSRQEKQRLKKKGVTEGHVTSRETRDPLKVSPHPFLNPEDNNDTARGDALYAESVENLQGLVHSRVGEVFWRDVDGFLRRRAYQTWSGWLKETLSILTGGTALPDDLAQVCRDDAALERPIGSPKGLRTFVASATRDRLAPDPAKPRARGGLAQRTFDNGRKALEGLP